MAKHERKPPPLPSFPAGRTPEALVPLLGETVVVDIDAHMLYLGKLEYADDAFLALSEVDVHEDKAEALSKEAYVHEARNIGVRANRHLTWVRMARVVSISRLADIKNF
ncbi:MAG: hypothetical protein M5U26_17145 [Planctomycetota bacterium]|nr:hypothetical protein [Planctomycetota bacterium]